MMSIRQLLTRYLSAFAIAFVLFTVPLIGSAVITCEDDLGAEYAGNVLTYWNCWDAGSSWLWRTYCLVTYEMANQEAERAYATCVTYRMIGG
jgi:hypothetical protein